MIRALATARRVGGLLVIAALCALAWRTAHDGAALGGTRLTLRPLPLVASIALETAVLAAGVLLWARVLSAAVATNASYAALLDSWWRSSVSRYLPGKVWPFVAVELARAPGTPRGVTAASLAVHSLLALAASALVGVAFAGAQLRSRVDLRGALVVCAACVVLVPFVRRIAAALTRALHHALGEMVPRIVRDTPIALLLALHAASWLAHGVALFAFANAVLPAPLPLASLPAVIGAGALAAGAGTLLGVAPAGLGVREAVLGALLAAHLPLSAAVLLAAAARLWATAAELLLGVVTWRWSTRAARVDAAAVAGGA